jgi:uncharacterized membrane protein YkoI
MTKNMPNNISKLALVGLLAAVAVVVTASGLFYQASAQSEDEDNADKEARVFEKRFVTGGDFAYANLDIDGSVNITEQVADQILSSAEVEFPEAATIAADAVDNGKVLGGNLGVIEGFLVYSFRVVDDDNRIYSVIVDAGNGDVLHTSEPTESMPEAVAGSIIGGPMGFSPFHVSHPGIGAVKVFEQPVEEEN